MTSYRLSLREKKILLLLLRLDENNVSHTSRLRESDMLMQILEPPERYVTTIAFRDSPGGRLVPILKEGSWDRTFRGLRKKGFVECARLDFFGHSMGGLYSFKYWLTEAGVKRTGEIRGKVKAYIDEWEPLVAIQTTPSP